MAISEEDLSQPDGREREVARAAWSMESYLSWLPGEAWHPRTGYLLTQP